MLGWRAGTDLNTLREIRPLFSAPGFAGLPRFSPFAFQPRYILAFGNLQGVRPWPAAPILLLLAERYHFPWKSGQTSQAQRYPNVCHGTVALADWKAPDRQC